MARRTAGTYGGYLRLGRLLDLQKTLSDAHDELQFIIVHQVNELWFRLLIFELRSARDAILRGDLAPALHWIRRSHVILAALTQALDVIETMRPHDFMAFRDALKPASGFQSRQFRELEYLCGQRDPRYLRLFRGADRAALRRCLDEPSLWDAYVDALSRHDPAAGSRPALLPSIVRILQEPDRHPLAPLTEALVEFDERFSLWRSRHIRLAMRMIGARPGTGQKSVARILGAGYDQMGSGGVEYLRGTLSKVFFPLLWEARTFVER